MLRSIYLQLLQRLCRRELKRIADKYPNTLENLIKYHEFMAIECVNQETKVQERIFGISINTAILLDKPR